MIVPATWVMPLTMTRLPWRRWARAGSTCSWTWAARRASTAWWVMRDNADMRTYKGVVYQLSTSADFRY